MVDNIPVIKKEKTYLRIVDIVIRLIAEGKVGYNDKFYTEQELMTMLGVSRPTLREALRVLEFLGVATVSPRHGISVNQPSCQDGYLPLLYILAFEKTPGRELFQLRQALQLEMTKELALHSSADSLQELYNILDEMEKQMDSCGEVFYTLDYQFHQKIVEASGNHLILKLMNTIGPMFHSQLLRHGERATTKQRKSTVDEHRQILAFIAAGDASAASAAMERHLADSSRDASREEDVSILTADPQ